MPVALAEAAQEAWIIIITGIIVIAILKLEFIKHRKKARKEARGWQGRLPPGH